MTPRERFTAAVDSLTSLSASDRLVLKAAGDEYAAGMIEAYAHPPLPERLAVPPVVVDARSLRGGGKGTVAVTESARGVTEAQDGVA